MDFWKVNDKKIVDNYVMVDFPDVMAQLGVDAFSGHGWEKFDRDNSLSKENSGEEEKNDC